MNSIQLRNHAQHQLFIWGNDTVGCRVLCGMCGTFFDSTFTELANGVICPYCQISFSEIDVDETGQCNHGVIGNGKFYTNKRDVQEKYIENCEKAGETDNEEINIAKTREI